MNEKRPLYLFFLLILCAAQGFSQSNPGWTILNSGTSNDLYDVHFVDDLQGYVVGANGTALRTLDGGDTWSPMQGLPAADLVSINFANADTGYTLTRNSSYLYTHDGGQSWQVDSTLQVNCFMERVRVAPDGLVYFLYFGCFETGRIMTFDPQTGDTTDHSTIYNFGFSYLDSIRDVDFPQPGHAVAVGDEGMIVRTTNGGSDWTVIPAPDTALQFVAVDFIDADTGFAVTTDIFAPRWKTTDGGLSWFTDPEWVATFFYPVWTDMEYLPSGFGLLAGAGGGMGLVFGRNYNFGAATFADSLNGVDLVRDSLAWVIGDNGFIARLGTPLLSLEGGMDADWQVSAFPNPSQGTLWVKSEHFRTEAAELELVDLQGKSLHRESVPAGGELQQINLPALPDGLYFLRVKTPERHATLKILID